MVPAVLREDPASRPFFCGRWPGRRNDYEGEDTAFGVCRIDCELTALGRPAEPPLAEPAMVSLWHAGSQELLASAMVGPASRVDGFYAWEPLMEPIILREGQEYRLSQRCRANMPDRWSDELTNGEEMAGKSWASLARFLGGVCRSLEASIAERFPNRLDGELRRPGIVNFKALPRPMPEPALDTVDREDFAKALAVGLAALPPKSLEVAQDELEIRLAALAGLLTLFVDELNGATAMALLAHEDELEIIASSAAAFSPTGTLELAGSSVFESKALCQEMSLAARRSGMLDAGLLLVSFTGEVLGLVLRPRSQGSDPESPMVFDVGRPLQPWELAKQLPEGLAFAKRMGGEVLAYDVTQLRKGRGGGPDQVRSFQFRMIELQELFTDPERSSFSVVTIPTTLALEETKRLLQQLEEQDIRCGLVIANRILDMEQVGQRAASQQKTQQVALEALEALAKREGMEVIRVPYLDREVQGIYGLQYLGKSLVDA
ncbi:ATPase GET3B (AtGET3B) (Guided entry of tail-anchored proteins 3 homolog B) [Durusdinium trenchii]|uniref:ATPase GET3B (AtGET3B) (Guided entry of tail-anchored proteins 3 homolog B) n=1 Tax=Durusdinium trenchii TaxID=1381693 RepID=A0ABP0L4J6_9DINO